MSLREYPKKPGISRFVAPWDTSGWYFMAEHFAPGCRIYSNADITVTECPEILRGCDYIVTYDSATDGFDDKQEVDFFIEQTGFNYFQNMDNTDAVLQMNTAKVCELMSWICQNCFS